MNKKTQSKLGALAKRLPKMTTEVRRRCTGSALIEDYQLDKCPEGKPHIIPNKVYEIDVVIAVNHNTELTKAWRKGGDNGVSEYVAKVGKQCKAALQNTINKKASPLRLAL